MSKGGGASKVYFVLYLAVILELLIIIVDRDEAEESLNHKQKESMKIVESILSQLQSGAGSEGINTRPQDEITIMEGLNNPEFIKNFKDFRRYIVEVGVTDITGNLKKKDGEATPEYLSRLKTLVKLGNVEELDYQVYFSGSQDPNNAPIFPRDEELIKRKIDLSTYKPGDIVQGDPAVSGSNWEFLSTRRLSLENSVQSETNPDAIISRITSPVYSFGASSQGPSFAPSGVQEDSVFAYSAEKTNESIQQGQTAKRSFFVQFKPPARPGWYKLRFASRTNRILGVRAEEKAAELPEETTVNIGTVQLTVRDLLKVKKELITKLAKYGLPQMEDLGKNMDIFQFNDALKHASDLASKEDNGNEINSQINLYGYIAKLLAPGQSANLAQNRGSIEFNIHVVKPDIPKADPTVVLAGPFATFDKVPAAFEFTISPYQGTSNIVSGEVHDATSGALVARLNCKALDELNSSITKPAIGGRREYRGDVEKELSAGKYKIIVKHVLNGKNKEEEADLEVFETKLTASSEKDIKNKFNFLAVYGNNLVINPEPTSGGKIKAQQFRIYLATDKETQKAPVEGLTATLPLTADANKAMVRVTWVQPYTGREVDLLPYVTTEIKQDQPKILTNNIDKKFSGVERKIKIKISGITITGGTAGDPNNREAKANVKVRMGKPIVKVSGYTLASDPIWSESDNSITVELSGALPRGEPKVKGNVDIPVIAQSTNPVNGKVSEEKTQTISVQVSYEPETEKRTQQRRR